MLIIRRSNCTNKASGIVTVCKWPSGMQVEREPQFPLDLHTGRPLTDSDRHEILCKSVKCFSGRWVDRNCQRNSRIFATFAADALYKMRARVESVVLIKIFRIISGPCTTVWWTHVWDNAEVEVGFKTSVADRCRKCRLLGFFCYVPLLSRFVPQSLSC